MLNEEGLYMIYYNGVVTGAAGAAYPLTATFAVYQDGDVIPASRYSVTLTAAGTQAGVRGDATVRVSAGPTARPSTIRVVNETAGVTWNYAEIIVGKSF